jgi:hypothetical protein
LNSKKVSHQVHQVQNQHQLMMMISSLICKNIQFFFNKSPLLTQWGFIF